MKREVLLNKYKTLILLSLEAQENNDVEQEERTIDALDVVWAKMSNDDRRSANKINQEAIAWFNARMHLAVQLDKNYDVQLIGSLSQTINIRARPIEVEISNARFGKMVVHWEDSSFSSWTSSRGGCFPGIAATA